MGDQGEQCRVWNVGQGIKAWDRCGQPTIARYNYCQRPICAGHTEPLDLWFPPLTVYCCPACHLKYGKTPERGRLMPRRQKLMGGQAVNDQDEAEAIRAQAAQELEARANKLVNNLPSGYGAPERVFHVACEAATHYGYTGALRQHFAELCAARWSARMAEDEQTRQEMPVIDVAPSPIYQQGELVTVWIAGISPCNAIIRHPDTLREDGWWYLCSMSGMFGAEHMTHMPEQWIKRPGEPSPVI